MIVVDHANDQNNDAPHSLKEHIPAIPTATALRSRWKTRESFGSEDPINGRKTMKKATAITCLILDIGGVLFTDE